MTLAGKVALVTGSSQGIGHFMHDHVHEGSVIPAKPPSGKLVLDVQNPCQQY